MSSPKRYTITAALPYANGPIHIGQLAGAYISPDIYNRYLKLKGENVVFICGSDEHGVAILLRANKEGKTPQEIVDKYHELNKKSFEKFGIEFDIFHRTSSELHHQTASEFFTDLYNKGEFVEQETEQFYDEENEQFLADRYIMGTCPRCGYESAYGDQCERCGSTLSPDELIDPHSAISGATPVKKKTRHWYLPMDKYEPWLKEWILEGHKDDWKKNVYGQCKSWLDQGLQPRAMTRDLTWGVPVPLPDAEGKVLYVWLDAPIGYISATREWARQNNRDWEPFWKDERTKLVHFIGKDNIVFHCIIFPIILKAKGDFILPANVPANEFMNMEGDKISTSRNWAVWLHEYLEELPGKEDVLRYVLTANMPETKDSEFLWKDFQEKNNNELVGNLGNFVNRVLTLTQKYYNGKVPDFDAGAGIFERSGNGQANKQKFSHQAFLKHVKGHYADEIAADIEHYRFRSALGRFMSLCSLGNLLIQQNEPWKLYKADPESPVIKNVLNAAVQMVGVLSLVGEPFLPFTARKITKMLNVKSHQPGDWSTFMKNLDSGEPVIATGHQLGKHELLFEKIDSTLVEAQINKLLESKTQKEVVEQQEERTPIAPQKEGVSFDEFMKMDMRIGEILSAEKVPKADKLLKLEVHVGFETRVIVSGIAEHFKPEALKGKKVVVLANLAPKKIRGVESKGMVLMAENEEGQLSFIAPEQVMPNGTEIR